MKAIIYQKLNKKNILFLIMLITLTTLSLLPRYSYANAPNPDNFQEWYGDPENRLFGYIKGNACGTQTCTPDQVCQKEYRGVLPIEEDPAVGQSNTSFTCVSPRPIPAPASPYRSGDTDCNDPGLAGGLGPLDGILGDTVSGLLGGTLSSLLGGVQLDLLGSLFSGSVGLKFEPPGGIAGRLLTSISDPLISQFSGLLGGTSGFSGLLNSNPSAGCAYNNINTVIDSRRLTAPLPVDIFNPLPLPVNVTSPTPLPVVVVDDLALYQQKELIDAPLAALQKAETISTVSDTLRYQISADNLAVNNYFSTKQLGWQFGALDTSTGVVEKEAIDVYGGYQNFSLDKNNDLAQYFRDRQDQKTKLPEETFTAECGNVTAAEAGNISWECAMLVMQPNNNPNLIAINTGIEAAAKSELVTELLDTEVKDGYMATTLNNNKNPLTKQIVTPSSNTKAMTDKVFAATIDQAIVSSGDNCFESIPDNIMKASLKPVLTQGLFNVSNPLFSRVTSNDSLKGTPGFSIIAPPTPTPSPGASPGPTPIPPDPDQFFDSIAQSLLGEITSSLSCVFNTQIRGLLNGILGNVLPGLGNIIPGLNISGLTGNLIDAAANAATGALNNAIGQ